MKRIISGVLLASSVLALSFAVSVQAFDDPLNPNGPPEGRDAPRRVVKSDAEWAKILTREQYYVTRMKGTEPAFTGKYARYHGKGVFTCVGCDEPLFDARTKFESGTGWPSFYQPVSTRNVTTQADYSDGSQRIEVNCATCGAHLGHVFGDGPAPTGMRFCINSAALKLQKPETSKVPKSKTSAKSSAKKTSEPAADKNADTPETPR